MVNSGAKGKRGEREAVDKLRELYPSISRTYGQARGGHEAADIDGDGFPWRAEVKCQKRPNPGTAYEQLLEDARDAGDTRHLLVLTKGDRRPWLATVELDVFIRLVSRIDYLQRLCESDVQEKTAP